MPPLRSVKKREDEGADALMVLPPFYLKTDADGLMYYFDAISRAVSIPIMVQDAPLMTQVPMPAALLARMRKRSSTCSTPKWRLPNRTESQRGHPGRRPGRIRRPQRAIHDRRDRSRRPRHDAGQRHDRSSSWISGTVWKPATGPVHGSHSRALCRLCGFELQPAWACRR